MHNGVDHSGGAHQTQEHANEPMHAHLHTHTGEHAHQHEGLSPETVHTHEHIHTHEHDHASDQAQPLDPDSCANRAEVVAMLTDTLQHNHHHNEELLWMQKQLRALGLDAEAEQLDIAISDFSVGNARLAELLKSLE
ncbi:MAG: cobalt transporter [Eubacteriales bacterium]|nr:cobalt transporter [Eubacteriales bacterium]